MRASKGTVPAVDLFDPQLQQFDIALCGVLLALLTFLPAALGSFQPWSELIAFCGALAAAIVLAAKLAVRTDVKFVWSWALVPLAGLIGFVLFQLIPLPQGVVQSISPNTVADRLTFMADLPAALKPNHFTLSFNPFQTWHDLRNLIVDAIVFVVALNLTRDSRAMRWMLWGIAIIGSAEALLDILQILTGATDIYWAIPVERISSANSGSLPNHNFFSQFVNLSSGATLALLLLYLDKTFHRHDYSAAEMADKLKSETIRPAYVAIVLLAINATSVFLSLSRGGMVGLLAAGLFAAILLAIRGGRRGMGVSGWFAGMAVLFIFTLIMASGYTMVESRVRQIAAEEDRHTRVQLAKDTLQMWKHYPTVGIGFGAYETTFPRFETDAASDNIATHAENEYVELLGELGWVGGALVAIFGVMVAGAFFAARRRSPVVRKHSGDSQPREHESAESETEEPHREHRSRRGHRSKSHQPHHAVSSLSIGIAFGFVAILVQSATDFAVHFLPVSCLVAAFSAVMINLAYMRKVERGAVPASAVAEYGSRTSPLRRITVAGVLVVFLIAMFPLAVQATRTWWAQRAWERTETAADVLREVNWKDVGNEVADLRLNADAAVRIDPANVHNQFWRCSYLYNILNALTPPPADRQQQLLDLKSDLENAITLCPTYGMPYSLLAQIEHNDLDQRSLADRNIQRGRLLAPHDSMTILTSGEMAADNGKWNFAIHELHKGSVMSGTVQSIAMNVLVDYYKRPDLLVDVAGDDVAALKAALAVLQQRDPPPTPITPQPTVTDSATTTASTMPATEPVLTDNQKAERQITEHIETLVRQSSAQPGASAEVQAEMGNILMKEGKPADAIPYFVKALDERYGQVDWRLAYGEALLATGDDAKALDQFMIVSRQRPGDPTAAKLTEEIRVRQAMNQIEGRPRPPAKP